MWELFRPYVVTSLDSKLIRETLPKYTQVIRNKLPANFQILKRIEATRNTWEEHTKLMDRYRKIKKQLEKNKIEFDKIPSPKYSLLDLKIELTKTMMRSCELCERKCRVDRLKGEIGICKVGNKCLISSQFIHMGEELHISPSYTIFFMGCNFRCQFCQNWSISQWYEQGVSIEPRKLGKYIETRRKEGVRNVNYVGGSPTPSLLWVLESLNHCNVNIPVIWNSNFYMSKKTMKILDGVIDMFLSDFKYGNSKCASRLSKISKYFETVSRNHSLASKQAEITVRHLILPNHVECCSKPVLDWISKNIRERCIVNLMDQYHPAFKATEYEDINRRITRGEFEEVVEYTDKLKINYIT